MTQQEYNDYIAHGGKWGYTNGVPNGKKKAQGLLDQANTLRKKAGKMVVKTGNQVVRGGKRVAYNVASEGNRQLMNYTSKKALKEAKSGSKVRTGKEVVNRLSEDTLDLDYGIANKGTKTSKRTVKNARKSINKINKMVDKYSKNQDKLSKLFDQSRSKSKKQAEKNLNKAFLDGKNKKIIDDLSSTSAAGGIQKKREKAAIAAAKRQDALRQQSSKSKKLEKTRKAQKELDKLHRSMYDRTKLYEKPNMSLDDHKKDNRTPKKHGQPSTTRGVRKQ